jgi:hypothetical protein
MSPASEPRTSRALRQLPNVITVLRALLIPVIGGLLVHERYEAAFWTLLASATKRPVVHAGMGTTCSDFRRFVHYTTFLPVYRILQSHRTVKLAKSQTRWSDFTVLRLLHI